MSVNLHALRANLPLSAAVAFTGIAAPMGLSFVLKGLLPLSPLQCFAAGAALCSTSLGTTFTVLSTSGLAASRLGVVLSSAAMMDDVVGLIMVQIVSSLGSSSDISAVTAIRPIFVSLAFAILIPPICLFIAKPLLKFARAFLGHPSRGKLKVLLYSEQASFVYQTLILLAMVTGATYAGTSSLFAAYLAGASVTWLSDFIATDKPASPPSEQSVVPATSTPPSAAPEPNQPRRSSRTVSRTNSVATSARVAANEGEDSCSGMMIYHGYYATAVNAVLRPFFFASIGFAIPISRMFTGGVIWRGIVYAALMTFAKLVCGLWLIRGPYLPNAKSIPKLVNSLTSPILSSRKSKQKPPPSEAPAGKTKSNDVNLGNVQNPPAAVVHQGDNSSSTTTTTDQAGTNANTPTAGTRNAANSARRRDALPKPKSLYPAALLGSAMVSRGEIGFLISSVAQTKGVFGGSGNDDEFLVVTWAILLCTLVGPITVGLLVKRVRALQAAERWGASGKDDPLGIWGVAASQ